MTSREEFEAWWKTVHPWRRTENREGAELGWQAARATAPAWHDAPTVPGLWVSSSNEITFRLDAYDVDQLDKFNPSWRKWYGPIPKDES